MLAWCSITCGRVCLQSSEAWSKWYFGKNSSSHLSCRPAREEDEEEEGRAIEPLAPPPPAEEEEEEGLSPMEWCEPSVEQQTMMLLCTQHNDLQATSLSWLMLPNSRHLLLVRL